MFYVISKPETEAVHIPYMMRFLAVNVARMRPVICPSSSGIICLLLFNPGRGISVSFLD